jgi:hypothetical protein
LGRLLCCVTISSEFAPKNCRHHPTIFLKNPRPFCTSFSIFAT